MRELTPEEIQLKALLIAKEVKKICDNNQIKYYLIGGALIGAKRNGKMIPWDDDIDIAMLREDYEKFTTCASKQLPKQFFLQNMFTDPGFVYPLTRICLKDTYRVEEYKRKEHQYLYIDIFPIDNIPINKRMQIWHKIKIDFLKQAVLRKTCPVLDVKSGKIKNFLKKFIQLIFIGSTSYWRKKLNDCMSCYKETGLVSSLASKYGYMKQIMPKKYYGYPSSILFCDTIFSCPEQVEKYLTHLYGQYLLPPSTTPDFQAKAYIFDKDK